MCISEQTLQCEAIGGLARTVLRLLASFAINGDRDEIARSAGHVHAIFRRKSIPAYRGTRPNLVEIFLLLIVFLSGWQCSFASIVLVDASLIPLNLARI